MLVFLGGQIFILFLACRINRVKIIQRISNDIFVDERLNNVITSSIKKKLFKINF